MRNVKTNNWEQVHEWEEVRYKQSVAESITEGNMEINLRFRGGPDEAGWVSESLEFNDDSAPDGVGKVCADTMPFKDGGVSIVSWDWGTNVSGAGYKSEISGSAVTRHGALAKSSNMVNDVMEKWLNRPTEERVEIRVSYKRWQDGNQKSSEES
jgi:hypothetical protein